MKTKNADPILIAQPGTPEWHQSRRQLIGASEAAAACGLSEWQSPFELYLVKRGECAPFEGNRRTRRGTHNEPFILEEFSREFGVTPEHYPMGLFRHPKHPFVGATPDAQISREVGLEIKDISARSRGWWGEQGTDEIPESYLIQSQQQMLVMGWRVVQFAVMCEDELLRYVVERDDELIADMLDLERDFWRRVEDGDPPAQTWTPDLVRRSFRKVEEGTRILLSERAARARAEYESLQEQIGEMEQRAKLLNAQVLAEIGNHYAGVLPGGERMIRRKVIPATQISYERKERIDARAVKYDGGEIIVDGGSERIESVPQLETGTD